MIGSYLTDKGNLDADTNAWYQTHTSKSDNFPLVDPALRCCCEIKLRKMGLIDESLENCPELAKRVANVQEIYFESIKNSSNYCNHCADFFDGNVTLIPGLQKIVRNKIDSAVEGQSLEGFFICSTEKIRNHLEDHYNDQLNECSDSKKTVPPRIARREQAQTCSLIGFLTITIFCLFISVIYENIGGGNAS